jgi:hypothetical protein
MTASASWNLSDALNLVPPPGKNQDIDTLTAFAPSGGPNFRIPPRQFHKRRLRLS